MNKKKGFVLYFDTEDMLNTLPPEQRGLLLSALFRFAREAAEGRGDIDRTAAELQGLTPAAVMAFRFVAMHIRRDSEKWLERQARNRQAAQTRYGRSGGEEPVSGTAGVRSGGRSGVPGSADPEVMARYVRELHRQLGPAKED